MIKWILEPCAIFVSLSSLTAHSIGSIICTNPPQIVIVIYAKHLSPFPSHSHNRSLPWMDSQFPRNQGAKTQGCLERSIRCLKNALWVMVYTEWSLKYLVWMPVQEKSRKFFISKALFTSMVLTAEVCSLNTNHSGRVNSFEMHFFTVWPTAQSKCTTALVSAK